jgi:endonuclease/exonuclease/phosphatase family metal-dependent hydrolase
MVATGYPVPMKRGYVAIDVTMSGAPFTFTATHLEVGSGLAKSFQEAQASELLAIVKKIPGTQLIAGDFNSNAITPSTASYGLFAANFTEAWPEGAVGDPGPTCCTDIDSPTPAPDARIDLLFHKGLVRTTAASRTGAAGARTPSGKLASDHLGAAFTLQIGH